MISEIHQPEDTLINNEETLEPQLSIAMPGSANIPHLLTMNG